MCSSLVSAFDFAPLSPAFGNGAVACVRACVCASHTSSHTHAVVAETALDVVAGEMEMTSASVGADATEQFQLAQQLIKYVCTVCVNRTLLVLTGLREPWQLRSQGAAVAVIL